MIVRRYLIKASFWIRLILRRIWASGFRQIFKERFAYIYMRSKLAVTSFVLAIIDLIIIFSNFLFYGYNFTGGSNIVQYMTLLFLILLVIASVLSIVSIVWVKKKEIEGLWMAVTAFIISVGLWVLIVLYILFLFFAFPYTPL